MTKSHHRKRRPDLGPFIIRVEATSVYISQMGPKIVRHSPEGEASTSITIEGEADRPVKGDLRKTLITVFCGHKPDESVGASIGIAQIWQIVINLPREQFADLLALVVAQRLANVHLVLDAIKRGMGTVRAAYFYTDPVPCESEDET